MELEDIHLATLALSALVILYSDHQGFEYFRGKKLLSARFVVWSHRLVWVGLLGMILSGASMVVPAWEQYFSDPAFYIKMGMVAVLMVNAFAIGKLSHVATETPFAELPHEQKRTLVLSGALSAMGWIGATVIGFIFL